MDIKLIKELPTYNPDSIPEILDKIACASLKGEKYYLNDIELLQLSWYINSDTCSIDLISSFLPVYNPPEEFFYNLEKEDLLKILPEFITALSISKKHNHSNKVTIPLEQAQLFCSSAYLSKSITELKSDKLFMQFAEIFCSTSLALFIKYCSYTKSNISLINATIKIIEKSGSYDCHYSPSLPFKLKNTPDLKTYTCLTKLLFPLFQKNNLYPGIVELLLDKPSYYEQKTFQSYLSVDIFLTFSKKIQKQILSHISLFNAEFLHSISKSSKELLPWILKHLKGNALFSYNTYYDFCNITETILDLPDSPLDAFLELYPTKYDNHIRHSDIELMIPYMEWLLTKNLPHINILKLFPSHTYIKDTHYPLIRNLLSKYKDTSPIPTDERSLDALDSILLTQHPLLEETLYTLPETKFNILAVRLYSICTRGLSGRNNYFSDDRYTPTSTSYKVLSILAERKFSPSKELNFGYPATSENLYVSLLFGIPYYSYRDPLLGTDKTELPYPPLWSEELKYMIINFYDNLSYKLTNTLNNFLSQFSTTTLEELRSQFKQEYPNLIVTDFL